MAERGPARRRRRAGGLARGRRRPARRVPARARHDAHGVRPAARRPRRRLPLRGVGHAGLRRLARAGRCRSPSPPWPTPWTGCSTRSEVARAHLVGLSLGGMVALHAALAHPRARALAGAVRQLPGLRPRRHAARRVAPRPAGRARRGRRRSAAMAEPVLRSIMAPGVDDAVAGGRPWPPWPASRRPACGPPSSACRPTTCARDLGEIACRRSWSWASTTGDAAGLRAGPGRTGSRAPARASCPAPATSRTSRPRRPSTRCCASTSSAAERRAA